MDDLLTTPEVEALWRLAGRQPSPAHPLQPNPKFEKLRPRVQAAMLELILRQLEQETAVVTPIQDDLVVLLTSTRQRIRTLGIRLSAQDKRRMSGDPGEERRGL
jgi:hypothetical protein